MSTIRYTVKSGDTLWAISRATLGQPTQWRRIGRYNNRAAVVRVTGRGIPNPDLIYPNQVLLIPALPQQKPPPAPLGGAVAPTSPPAGQVPISQAPAAQLPSAQPLRNSGGTSLPSSRTLSEELKETKSPISIKYRLDDLRFPPIVQPGVIMEMRITGDVLLMTQRAYPAVYVTQRQEIEAQVVSQANHAFGSLVNDTRLIYDSKQNNLTYRSMLVSQSGIPNTPAAAIGVQMDSTNPMPRLRFEFRSPKLSGSVGAFNYTAVDVKVVVELTPTSRPPSGPSA